MKKMVLMIAAALFIVASFAQAQTMVIHANDGNLNEVITADQNPDGTQKHSVYQLVSLDTTYLFTGAIVVNGDITIEGVVDPTTKRPPCIQPAVLITGDIPPTFLSFSNAGSKGMLKNVYMLAIAPLNAANPDGAAIMVTGDNVRLTVENCVFDGWQSFGVGYSGNWDSFFFINNTFRNFVHPNQHYIGEILRNTWPGTAYTDTVSFVGNTMLCINGYVSAPVTKYYEKYFEFINNKVLYTFKNPFFIFNVTEAKINDNVFYANYSGGVDQSENPWWDNLWFPDSSYGVIALQPLDSANKAMFNPADPTASEGLRNVEVKNNLYYWPSAIVDFWSNWNNTQTNKIFTPSFMNDRTVDMFADDVTYPFLVESGNVNQDYSRMANINNEILNGTTGNDVGFLAYFEQIRNATAASDVWGYAPTQVGANVDWVPAWPLPESPSSIDEPTPAVTSSFALNKVYPNPFNPTAKVEYTLTKAGNATLSIYNLLGQHVTTIVNNEYQTPNNYEYSINMENHTSGMYFLVLTQNNNRSVKKIMLLK